MSDIPRTGDQPAHDEAANIEPIMLRTKDAARLLEISVRHLRSLVRSGRVPHVRFGRSIRFPLELLRELVKREAAKSVRRAKVESGES